MYHLTTCYDPDAGRLKPLGTVSQCDEPVRNILRIGSIVREIYR